MMQAVALPRFEDRQIQRVRHADATVLARTEFDRFLNLVESLSDEDWQRPTRCTRWNVQQTVAHLAGSAAAYARFSEFRRQNSGKVQRPYRLQGLNKLDAQNQIQVDDRAAASPGELLTEFRALAPRELALRSRLPAPVRALRLPLGLTFPLDRTWISVGYLTDIILTRDMWMHRLDISLATGREMVLTPEHDGRITALVVRDVGQNLRRTLDRAVRYELTGPAGGSYLLGRREPASTIRLDACDFHLLASRYATLDEIRPRVELAGDASLGEQVLAETRALY